MANEGQSRIDHTLPHLRTTPQRSCKLPAQGQQGRRVGRAWEPSLGQQHLPARCQSLYPEAFPSALLSSAAGQEAVSHMHQDQGSNSLQCPTHRTAFQSICHSNAVTTINRNISILSFRQKLLSQCLKSLRSPNSDSSQDSAKVRRRMNSMRSHTAITKAHVINKL